MTDTTAGLLAQLAGTGRDPVRGGFSRPVFGRAERELLEWARDRCARRGLDVEVDGNGVLWAWWNPAGHPLVDAVGTGSHLDSVPGGGAFDGPLGVASALRRGRPAQGGRLRPGHGRSRWSRSRRRRAPGSASPAWGPS